MKKPARGGLGGEMEDGLIRAAASGLGVAFYWLLIQGFKRQEAACWRKHGRTLLQQSCYRLGRLWSVGHKKTKQALRLG